MITPKCHTSLRARIGKIVLIFSILLVSFYTTMLAMLYQWGLADATHGVVWQEAHLFKQAYAKDPNAPLPNTRSLKGFIGEENLPASVLQWFPPHKWENWGPDEEGMLYRFQKNEGSESHYHLLISRLPNTGKRFFIFYNITVADEIAAKVWHKFKILAFVGGILVVTMLVVFRATIGRSLKPITSLSRWIENLDQKHPPNDLPNDIQADEIGQMAGSLYNALLRIHQYNERERKFLRNASHELRTPIAIIRNAMDVLEHKRKIGNDDIDCLLQRIRRAGDTMKSVTEAILWLAVEDYAVPSSENTDIRRLINEIIDANKNLNNGKSVAVNTQLDAIESRDLQSALAHIVLDNLIRNAFQHCTDGEICIKAIGPSTLEIINPHHAYSEADKHQNIAEAIATGSFGLGLALVKTITERQGWKFEFNMGQEQATAMVAF